MSFFSSEIKRYEFSTYFYHFLFFLFLSISNVSSRLVSSRLVSREIKLERESTLVRKFCKRGMKFDRGSKRGGKKGRTINNETRHWIRLETLKLLRGVIKRLAESFRFV